MKKFVAMFIFVWVSAALVHLWLNPRGPFYRTVRPIITGLGLWREYRVFAPNPPKRNTGLLAVVTFTDGAQLAWQSPMFRASSAADKERCMHYRKFMQDHVVDRGERVPERGVARFIARTTTTAEHKAKHVRLIGAWSDMPPLRADSKVVLPPFTHSKTLYEYNVTAEDLI